MDPRQFFNWLIVLTVAAGLVFMPLAAPVMAGTHQAAASGEIHAMHGGAQATDDAADDMQGMAGDMPCCPDEGTPAKGCDSCPLMALCSMMIAVPAPSQIAGLARDEAGQTAFVFPDDLRVAGLGARPPDHPPRTIV